MDHLRELWARFGYWQELLISRDFKGQEGQAIMDSLMSALRSNPPSSIAGVKVEAMRDFNDGSTLNITTGERVRDILLPSSDVLQYVLEDGSLVTARPSGTEPKIKFYASCRSDKGDEPDAAKSDLAGMFAGIDEWVNGRISSVGG